jgi:hypothetical protein
LAARSRTYSRCFTSTSIARAAKDASAAIAILIGRTGASGDPIGVLLVFLPCSLVGEYCPLVSP